MCVCTLRLFAETKCVFWVWIHVLPSLHGNDVAKKQTSYNVHNLTASWRRLIVAHTTACSFGYILWVFSIRHFVVYCTRLNNSYTVLTYTLFIILLLNWFLPILNSDSIIFFGACASAKGGALPYRRVDFVEQYVKIFCASSNLQSFRLASAVHVGSSNSYSRSKFSVRNGSCTAIFT